MFYLYYFILYFSNVILPSNDEFEVAEKIKKKCKCGSFSFLKNLNLKKFFHKLSLFIWQWLAKIGKGMLQSSLSYTENYSQRYLSMLHIIHFDWLKIHIYLMTNCYPGLAQEQGISVVFIYETEWRPREEIYKGIIIRLYIVTPYLSNTS